MTPRLAVFLRAFVSKVNPSPATLAGLRVSLEFFFSRAPWALGGFCAAVLWLGMHPQPKPPLLKLPASLAKKVCKPCAAKAAAMKQASVPLRPEPDPISAAPKEGE